MLRVVGRGWHWQCGHPSHHLWLSVERGHRLSRGGLSLLQHAEEERMINCFRESDTFSYLGSICVGFMVCSGPTPILCPLP